MRRSKLREHLERLQVESRRLIDEALLAFDVGQIVQRVRVRRTQPEGRVVATLGLLHLQRKVGVIKRFVKSVYLRGSDSLT